MPAPRPGCSRGELGVQALLPLARRPRQRDRLGRPARRLRRPGRARRRDRGGAARTRAAAAGPLPTRLRPPRGASLLVRRGRLAAARARRRGAAPPIDDRRLAYVVHGGDDPETTAALAAQEEPLVEDDGVSTAHLVAGAIPEPDWSRRILDAHAEGFAAVGGSIQSPGARARGRGRPVAAATRLLASRCSCRRCSTGLEPGRARGSARPTSRTGSRRSSTGGSDFDCHAVVDAVEDERAERERDDRGDDEVDRRRRPAAARRRRAGRGPPRSRA